VTPLGQFATLCSVAFLAMLSYALARPPSESLFLARYTKAGLPLVWLAVAVGVVITVAVYNRFAGRVPLGRLMAGVSWTSAVILAALLAALELDVPHVPFLLYVWKDVYVVVMVEVFWTFVNSTTSLSKARWTYGLFLCAGALGGIVGNLGVGELATRYGTAASMIACVVDLAIVGAVAWLVVRRIAEPPRPPPTQLGQGLETLRRSRLLPLLLALVVVTQLCITFVDYDFNGLVAETYPNADARTKAIGQVYARIDFLQVVLQLTAALTFRVVGIDGVLLLVPLVLGGCVAGFLLSPTYATIATVKVVSKGVDYSLFKASKEMLYIPLSPEERTRGKAIVDIVGYRVAKGGVSLVLLALGAVAIGAPSRWTLGLVVVWLGVAFAIVRRRVR
jgi:ATP:ADP antiporter, AAA family